MMMISCGNSIEYPTICFTQFTHWSLILKTFVCMVNSQHAKQHTSSDDQTIYIAIVIVAIVTDPQKFNSKRPLPFNAI